LRGRAFVALVVVVLLLFAGAARAMHSSARSKVVIWCDGIDDATDEGASPAVENKKTGEVSPVIVCVSPHVRDGSPTTRDVHRACDAGDQARGARELLFRPRQHTIRISALNDSPTPH
jgi:hypothetical protein